MNDLHRWYILDHENRNGAAGFIQRFNQFMVTNELLKRLWFLSQKRYHG
jgi:hypothetical protein